MFFCVVKKIFLLLFWENLCSKGETINIKQDKKINQELKVFCSIRLIRTDKVFCTNAEAIFKLF